MAKANDLTVYAQAGFRGERNTHIYSSPAWYAHELGVHMSITGRTEPSDVRMSRGATVRVRDLIFAHRGKGSVGNQIFERIA